MEVAHFSVKCTGHTGWGRGTRGMVSTSRLVGMREEKILSLFWKLKKTQILSLQGLFHLPPPPAPHYLLSS